MFKVENFKRRGKGGKVEKLFFLPSVRSWKLSKRMRGIILMYF